MFMKVCENGATRVIVSAGCNKHETKDQDSRVSITMYRNGSIYGVTGPTIFLVEGNNKRVNCTDNFLQDNGVSPGSTFLVTPMMFMSEEAWITETPTVVCGLRISDTTVVANLQW